MSQKLDKLLTYLIPGFFGSLVFFCVPHAAGGYRVVKWACSGFILFFIAVLLYRRLEHLRLPSSKVLLISVAAFPLSLAAALFSDGTDISVCLIGISRYCTGLAFSILAGCIWSSLDKKQKENTFLCLLIIAALASIPLIISFVGMYRQGYFFEPDITGTFGNPNWAAGYLVTALPVALCFLVAAPGNLKKRLAGVSLVLVLAGIAVSFSKAAIVTGIVILIAGFLVLYRNRALIKYSMLLGAPVLFLSILYFQDTLLLWLGPRLFIWQALLKTIGGSWLTGNGALQALRTIEGGAAQLINGDIGSYMPAAQVDFVHNDYLQALAEGGLAGIVSFLALFVCTLVKAYRSESRLVKTAGLSLFALGINGLGESPLQVPVTFFAWWFFAGIIWFNDISAEGFKISGIRAVKGFLILAMVLFLAEGIRQALGAYYWTKSGQTTTLLQQKKYLQRASFFMVEAGNAHKEYAQALARSRQYGQARAAAQKAKSVKFAYDDLYLIAECDISLKVKDPLSAWKTISDNFPCLNYPKLKLAEFFLEEKQYQLARDECNKIISNTCPSVSPHKPYYNQAAKILERIDRLP